MWSSWAFEPFGYLDVHNLPKHLVYFVVRLIRSHSLITSSRSFLMIKCFCNHLCNLCIHISSNYSDMVFWNLFDEISKFAVDVFSYRIIRHICWAIATDNGHWWVTIECGNHDAWIDRLHINQRYAGIWAEQDSHSTYCRILFVLSCWTSVKLSSLCQYHVPCILHPRGTACPLGYINFLRYSCYFMELVLLL